ncbi:hydroxymethylglutaryl-CoA synthase [Levilactobacillus bambusae]|uniref:Hydroxymethylglutaryl-CoA synthase n=1 Tax=Levilactobacillus bambusae TaxID=2024736 RepID=A0A2V1N0B4_9LACO|nr:hydroxymethylglutaryl-CoA synthase [Levilactobacillus bambusae]PWG00711.1 hydroxymethylglutaryl-CoA synthase [Levilactobacillus bambusae]
MTTNVGIDKIGFYAPNYYVDMTDLAEARHEDPNKYLIGIGQNRQAVIPPTQDVVTMAANAADSILTPEDKEKISLVLFGTESGIDNSKSAAVYLMNLIGVNNQAKAVELKQACFGATAGIDLAKNYLMNHPDEKALVIGADVARYGIKTPGEVTQGGGAVVMLLSQNPRILVLDTHDAHLTRDIMDFWRPNYRTEALVDGKYSEQVYLDFFTDTFHRYLTKTGFKMGDFEALIFHLPFTKMGVKALRTVLPEADERQQEVLKANFDDSRVYAREVGNLYTGSLYLSLLSLLETGKLSAGDRVGLFSYGSGAEGEFYSGVLVPNYQDQLNKIQRLDELNNRTKLSVQDYETMFMDQLPTDGSDRILDLAGDHATFVLAGLKDQQRQYRKQTVRQ